MATPAQPEEVLAFWFGPVRAANRQALSTEDYAKERMRLWWSGDAESDAACGAFADTIHAAGKGELTAGAWAPSPDASLAKVLLLDQLSRGAFRGRPEAFAYDSVAGAEALAAVEANYHATMEGFEKQFLLMPLMHSEAPAHHELCVKLFSELADSCRELLPRPPCLNPALETAADPSTRSPAHTAIPSLKYSLAFAQEHAAVIQRFGRFPHRNAAMGRSTTPEEAAWLASPECPGWAKSQMARAEQGRL